MEVVNINLAYNEITNSLEHLK